MVAVRFILFVYIGGGRGCVDVDLDCEIVIVKLRAGELDVYEV
jgi:hypothetical protein